MLCFFDWYETNATPPVLPTRIVIIWQNIDRSCSPPASEMFLFPGDSQSDGDACRLS